MSETPPYFFSDALRTRYIQNIHHAIAGGRVSSGEGLWLLALVADTPETGEEPVRPRVDRLVMSDGSATGAELAGALLISDPDDSRAPVYLSTLSFGIERFEQRTALLAALQQRFDEIGTTSIVEAERVEKPVFAEQMRAVIEQQARHLDDLSVQLDNLPDLRTALGRAVQASQPEPDSGGSIDVYHDFLQIIDTTPPAEFDLTPVAGTLSLVDAAMDDFVNSPALAGMHRQFLDARGQVLSEEHARARQQSITDAVSTLGNHYEQLLVSYWTSERQNGVTVLEFFIRALAESFRQHLLASRENGLLSEEECRHLFSLLPSHAAASGGQATTVKVYRLAVVVAGQEPVKLIGLFLVEFLIDKPSGVYLYSSLQGFKYFENLEQLAAHFVPAQARAELRFYSSLNDHSLVNAQGGVELYHEVVSAPFFTDYLDSIIALQRRNLRYVLELPVLTYEKTPVRIDDALDIRGLLDGRLLSLRDGGRWHPESMAFDEIWGVPAPAADVPFNPGPALLDTWVEKLRKMESLLERTNSLHVGVDGCMRRTLNLYLALIEGPRLDARALWIASQTANEPPVPLLALALGRVSGNLQSPLPSGRVMEGLLAPTSTLSAQRLPLILLEQMLQCVLADFPQRFDRQMLEFHSRSARRINTQVRPYALHSLIREYALRLEMLMEKRESKLPEWVLQSVQQLLDRPLSGLREQLGAERVDGFLLSIHCDASTPAITLPNAFVLCNAGHAGEPVLWALGIGLKVFDSMQALEQSIKGLLTGAGVNPKFLNLLADPDRQLLLDYHRESTGVDIRIELRSVSGHFIEALQDEEIERQRRTVSDLYQQAVAWQVPSALFKHLINAAECDDRNRQILSDLGVAIQIVVYKKMVPAWMLEASSSDQVRLANALRRFYVTCISKKDFLFDVPSLYDYSQQQLTRKLEADFPEEHPDPENIRVTLTHFVPAPVAPGQLPQSIPAATEVTSENLVEFAANRLMSRFDGAISLAAEDGQPLSSVLTPAYVNDVVEALDVAAGYRELLDTVLTPGSPTYPERFKLFVEQMPSLDLLRALALKLRKEITDQAYGYIEGVLDMPDAMARLPVQGCKVLLSPLQLLPASEGWSPTLVINTYLIGPADQQSGPWVLYALMHDDFVFKEYPDQAALLQDIRTSVSLQSFILDRIDPQMRTVYDKGGFMEPHLPFSVESSFDVPWQRPDPVTLAIAPFDGNALQLLFKGALDVLKLQVKQSSVTSSEHRRSAAQYLFTLGAGQIMGLLPGRLGALVGILQSQTLLNSSLAAAGEQRWGKALSELIAALSVMISARQNPQVLSGQPSEEVQGSEAILAEPFMEVEDIPYSPEFSWSSNSLTQQIRIRLREFEVNDIAVNTLQRDELLNTYNDAVKGRRYAAVDGKVYQLKRDRDGWFIVRDGVMGPSVGLDTNQRWKLNVQAGLKGGGGVVTRIENNTVNELVDEIMVVNARGMSEIRQSYREMAQAIEEGHAQAQRYLENCMGNLSMRSPEGLSDPRVEKILSDFFEVKSLDTRLHEITKKTVTRIYDELMDPSLSPVDSPRYVVGINRLGSESSSAFIFETDPSRRVFLTEQFFRLPSYRLKVSAVRAGDFRFGPHYRAAILIHELSHLVLKTDDIAYLDSHAPYTDLLNDSSAYRARLRDEQATIQRTALSFSTDRSQLFKQLEGGAVRDLRRMDGNGKRTILRITGKSTLEEARDVFYSDVHKRADIMLKNADSVALLVTLLGRQRFVKR
ncbi:dermonecrotic toxin domain-containing protein [Pseudomonas syringae]|uniref:dermonecrotic toxin domain-containing protein n=1 Tax=Pseudomonas syringae TaxID=317 RepID=UPI003F759D18